MQTNWSQIRASEPFARKVRCRVVKPTGWGGGYKRKPPSGTHKPLPRSEMRLVLAKYW